jgi:LysR family glycine cleavage system transcriptional activator
MRLTAAGEKLAIQVGKTLIDLADAMRDCTDGPASRELRLGVMSSFATRWLLPRVGRFVGLHPEIDLHLSSTSEPRFKLDELDVAISYGTGESPAAEAELLLADEFSPVCSPTLASHAPRHPADLARFRLLRSRWETWASWFRAARLDWPEPARGPVFEDPSHMLQAAEEGQGVALARRSLSMGAVSAGTLIEPFAIRVPAEKQLYLLCRPAAKMSPRVRSLRLWLLEELAATRAVSEARAA